jgi:hypothetical protein
MLSQTWILNIFFFVKHSCLKYGKCKRVKIKITDNGVAFTLPHSLLFKSFFITIYLCNNWRKSAKKNYKVQTLKTIVFWLFFLNRFQQTNNPSSGYFFCCKELSFLIISPTFQTKFMRKKITWWKLLCNKRKINRHSFALCISNSWYFYVPWNLMWRCLSPIGIFDSKNGFNCKVKLTFSKIVL